MKKVTTKGALLTLIMRVISVTATVRGEKSGSLDGYYVGAALISALSVCGRGPLFHLTGTTLAQL